MQRRGLGLYVQIVKECSSSSRQEWFRNVQAHAGKGGLTVLECHPAQHSKARACCSDLKDQPSTCLTVAAEVSLRCFELRVCWPRPNGKAKRQKGESQETRRQPDAAVHWLDHWIGSDLWVGFAPSSYSATQELETSHSTR